MKSVRWAVIGMLVVFVVFGCDLFGNTRATVIVENSSSNTVTSLWMRLSTSEEWGENLIAGQPIAPGSQYTISRIDPDTYDLLAGATVDNDVVAAWAEYDKELAPGDSFTWSLVDR